MMLDRLPPVRMHHDRRRRRGGEYDEIRSLDRVTVRRLVGAGFIHPSGEPPDVFAEAYCDLFGCELEVCDVIRRWSRDAIYTLDERQREARLARDRALVARCGDGSLFEHRTHRAVEHGFRSYRHMRREMGWAG